MNYNVNSSGIYDVNAFNLTSKNVTIISSLNISGNAILNNFTSNNVTVLSSLNISGFTFLNNSTTINSPLYISTTQNTLSPNALNVNASTLGPMVNLIQNTPYLNNLNPALNVTGYSNFGGVQINGQDNNNIYKLSGDLSIVSPSINNILLKTNYGNWETMRINPYGVSVNTKLYVSGTTTLNNDVTCMTLLNVVGYGDFGGLKVDGNDSLRTIIQKSGPLSMGTNDGGSLVFFTNNNSEKLRINSDGNVGIGTITPSSLLHVSGTTTLNNAVTCFSSLNVSGRTIIGNDIYNFSDSVVEMYKNFHIRKNIPNLGDRLELKVGLGTHASYLSMEEGYDINLFNSIGSISLNSYNTAGNTISLQAPQVNVSKNLVATGSIYANNLASQKPFTFTCSTLCAIVNTQYYRYDLDLTQYTTYITNSSGSMLRKFKWMSWLASGAHNTGQYSLNYDIDYAYAQNISPTYNGLNALAYGYPCNNYNLNQVTPNGVFIWAYTFNQITIFSNIQASYQAIIIDYLQ